MNYYKIILINLFFWFGNGLLMACFCKPEPFCEVLSDSSHVVEAKVLNRYESNNTYRRYIDLEITEYLYGTGTSFDTITYVDNRTSCDLYLYDYIETGAKSIYMFDLLIIDESANFPTFNLRTCDVEHLSILGDSLRGLIAEGLDMIDYESFKENIGEFCGMLVSASEIPLENVSIYPNPVSEELIIDMSSNQNIQYSILSHTGAIILSGKVNGQSRQNINTSSLSSGIYYIQIRSRETYDIRKFIKL